MFSTALLPAGVMKKELIRAIRVIRGKSFPRVTA